MRNLIIMALLCLVVLASACDKSDPQSRFISFCTPGFEGMQIQVKATGKSTSRMHLLDSDKFCGCVYGELAKTSTVIEIEAMMGDVESMKQLTSTQVDLMPVKSWKAWSACGFETPLQ